MTLSIIIPVYNESATLTTIVERVLATDFSPHRIEVILVNDGSTDETATVARALPTAVLVQHHTTNKGKAAAIRTGLQRATGDYVVIQDGDLEYQPADIRTLLEYAIRHNVAAVYGSRNRGTTSKGRFDYYWGGRLVTVWCNLLFGTRLTDEATCYKLIRRETLSALRLTEERFDFCPEVTAKLLRTGVAIHELPITYAPRTTAQGKKIRYSDGARAIWILTKYWWLHPTSWQTARGLNK
jgi:glycosyltransferase involved in cell wall biosynthesis